MDRSILQVSRSCLMLPLILLCLTEGLKSQIPTPKNSNPSASLEDFSVKIGVQEVRLDAVVVDTQGRQITDLTVDDFELYQDGKRQRITASKYIMSTCAVTAASWNRGMRASVPGKPRRSSKGGVVDPNKLAFTSDYARRVREVADSRVDELVEAYAKVGVDVYREHPFYQPSEQVAKLREAMKKASLEPPA
jgi:hypothetical protein